MPPDSASRHPPSAILIVGGGISGLALGRALTEKGKDNRILEATDRPGGVIDTVVPAGTAWQLNYGANTVFVDEEVMGFLSRAGLAPNIVEPSAISKHRYILKGDQYEKLPAGPLSLIFNSFFSWKTKRRILQELRMKPHIASPPFSPKGGEGGPGGMEGPPHESVHAFFLRHFGQEVVDLAVQPFLAGIYAGDARELLMELVFPNLLKLEAEYGSILKGLRKQGMGTGRRKSIAFVMGQREMTEALADMTQAIHGCAQAERIERLPGNRWATHTTDGQTFEAEKLVLSLPDYEAARLLAPWYPDVARRLTQIHYAPLAQVHIGFVKQDINQPIQGFGGLHPPGAKTFTSGVLWVSQVLPMRAPAGQNLLVAFVGGIGRTDIQPLTDEQILDQTEAELRRLYQIDSPATLRHLRRWERAIPQYDRHLLGVQQAINPLEADNLYINANYLGGVSVQDCIKKGIRLAQRL